ncbi:hypothetical protein [Pontiella sulfatireligans]|uniref:REP-associated tyrosine transposase n=1 Tax=Pontiella sulfatireligans TaxID=2750658 RepID=A0A6C2UP71_9BACT|nr:hypothetical protein [Pontiella sulfatireligans]VGO21107.1 REP-associated tyrosine transposase [Pontiella sulfatireligans]
MYDWRKLTEAQREELLARRKQGQRPWHSPPHFESDGFQRFHLSSACFEHRPLIGETAVRIAEFETSLLESLTSSCRQLYAWCVLPNHWHALVGTDSLKETIAEIGQLHGRTSFLWNREDEMRGRKCWHGCADRRIRSSRHYYSVINYIHHNPVKHGYAKQWEDWPFSSATEYIKGVGREAVLKQWNDYPVLDMGAGWDD